MESLFIASAPPGDIAEWFNTRANEAIRRIERWKKKDSGWSISFAKTTASLCSENREKMSA
jgi:hypothetical protein